MTRLGEGFACWAEEFHLYSIGTGIHRKILRAEVTHTGEACIIHIASRKEENHFDTVAMLEAKRSRS